MGTTTNLGGQILTFRYAQDATSETFNRVLHGVAPQGIYEGATLTVSNAPAGLITIDPGKYIVSDPSYSKIVDLEPYVEGVSITVHQTLAISDLQIDTTNPYVIASFSWENISENYVEFRSASISDINTMIGDGTPPIILGRGVFIAGLLQEEFDYTRRTVPFNIANENKHNELKVQSDSDGVGPSGGKGVYVSSGTVVINNKRVTWAGGFYNPSPAIPDTVLERIDIIYLSRTGTIEHKLGTEHSSNPQPPEYPNDGVVLAEIRRGQNRDSIGGNEIFNLDITRFVSNDLIWGTGPTQINASSIPILNNEGRFTASTVEGALKNIVNDALTFYGDKTFDTPITGDLIGNAVTASAFDTPKEIELTGVVTGSASGTDGWVINTEIGDETIVQSKLKTETIDIDHTLSRTTSRYNSKARYVLATSGYGFSPQIYHSTTNLDDRLFVEITSTAVPGYYRTGPGIPSGEPGSTNILLTSFTDSLLSEFNARHNDTGRSGQSFTQHIRIRYITAT